MVEFVGVLAQIGSLEKRSDNIKYAQKLRLNFRIRSFQIKFRWKISGADNKRLPVGLINLREYSEKIWR